MDTRPKTYKMLKTTQGVRDGAIQPQAFARGATYELDAGLAEQFYNLGVVEEVTPAADPEARSRKVAGPTEFKDGQGQSGIDPATLRIEELVTLARDTFGLDVDSKMSPAHVLAAIESARAKASGKAAAAAPADAAREPGAVPVETPEMPEPFAKPDEVAPKGDPDARKKKPTDKGK